MNFHIVVALACLDVMKGVGPDDVASLKYLLHTF